MKQRHVSSRKSSSSKYRKRVTRPKMSEQIDESAKTGDSLAIQFFEPDPAAVYPIEAVAQLAGVSRRMILVYCKHNLISPSADPTLWGYWFTADTIRTLREIQGVRNRCQDEIQTLSTILGLLDEIKHLHAVIRGNG